MPGEQQQIPQELLDSLTRIDCTPSPPPQGNKLLPEINQVNKCEKRMMMMMMMMMMISILIYHKLQVL